MFKENSTGQSMIEYRIYTENLSKCKVKKLISSYYPGYTVVQAVGVWQNKTEHSIIICIIARADEENVVRSLAERIGKMNKQKEVLVTAQECTAFFLKC